MNNIINLICCCSILDLFYLKDVDQPGPKNPRNPLETKASRF